MSAAVYSSAAATRAILTCSDDEYRAIGCSFAVEAACGDFHNCQDQTHQKSNQPGAEENFLLFRESAPILPLKASIEVNLILPRYFALLLGTKGSN